MKALSSMIKTQRVIAIPHPEARQAYAEEPGDTSSRGAIEVVPPPSSQAESTAGVGPTATVVVM